MLISFGAGALEISRLAEILGGELIGDGAVCVHGICTDSREVERGILFVALPGERTDGHNYISVAIEHGGDGFIVSRREAVPDGVSAVLVNNTESALMRLAKYFRSIQTTRCVGVTGSVGKTTTKELIASVLSQSLRVHKTRGNFNSTIGMPLSVMETPTDAEVAVLEMAMSGLGEIHAMSMCARPEVAVITTIGSSHMELLGSQQNIKRAKLEIIDGLRNGGTLILNGDDPLLHNVSFERGRTLSIGIDDYDVDYRAEQLCFEDGYSIFDVRTPTGVLRDMRIPAIGKHNVYAALFAVAVGEIFGVDAEDIRAGLRSYVGMQLRQNVYPLGDITVIEDCYNASPESMRAALEVLSMLRCPGGRTVAVLGDMRELGDSSQELHRSVGVEVARHNVDMLFTLGTSARYIAAGALEGDMDESRVFVNLDVETYAATAWELCRELHSGDVVLFKASRAVRAERVIQSLKEIYH